MTQKPSPSNDRPASEANAFGAALNGAVAEAMEKSLAVFGKGMRSFQQEGLKFMTRRIELNMKAAEQFGACRTLPDLIAAQQKWFAETSRAYNEELTRCGELMTEAFEGDAPHAAGRRDHQSHSN